MGTQMVFDRREVKYLLTRCQHEELRAVLADHMQMGEYGHSTVRSVYYDTPDYRIIRRSLEKPIYKEKLRLRSYCQVSGQAGIYVELKKKYQSVVYKRRIELPEAQAVAWLRNDGASRPSSQIADEIEYFRHFYGNLSPSAFISAERDAYFDPAGSDFRITVDASILARTDRLSLTEDVGGISLLPPQTVLMELKTAQALPLWMTKFLAAHRIYPTSFSKYGMTYRTLVGTRWMEARASARRANEHFPQGAVVETTEHSANHKKGETAYVC